MEPLLAPRGTKMPRSISMMSSVGPRGSCTRRGSQAMSLRDILAKRAAVQESRGGSCSGFADRMLAPQTSNESNRRPSIVDACVDDDGKLKRCGMAKKEVTARKRRQYSSQLPVNSSKGGEHTAAMLLGGTLATVFRRGALYAAPLGKHRFFLKF